MGRGPAKHPGHGVGVRTGIDQPQLKQAVLLVAGPLLPQVVAPSRRRQHLDRQVGQAGQSHVVDVRLPVLAEPEDVRAVHVAAIELDVNRRTHDAPTRRRLGPAQETEQKFIPDALVPEARAVHDDLAIDQFGYARQPGHREELFGRYLTLAGYKRHRLVLYTTERAAGQALFREQLEHQRG